MTAAAGTAPSPAAEPVPVWWGLETMPASWGPSVLAIGVFDGVHRGHARLIEHAVRTARACNLPAVLVTFDPHPARFLGIPRDTRSLTTVDHRAELAGALGIDAVVVLRFSQVLADLSPDAFVRDVLVRGLQAQAVVVGANFTFGARAAGTVETLHELAAEHGFTAHAVGLLHATDRPCSSTFARDCLRRGDVAGAADALGRLHEVTGTVEEDGLVHVAPYTALPAAGRYRVHLSGPSPARHIDIDVLDDDTLRLPGPHGLPTGQSLTIRFAYRCP